MKSRQYLIKKLKATLEKVHGRSITNEELDHSYNLVTQLADIFYDNDRREIHRKKKLGENPKGFHLNGKYCCIVCGLSAENENSWYDKNGIKCILCQKALDKKLIPRSVINKNSWYSLYDLERYFNMDRADRTKFVKSGLLKKRMVPSDGRKPHLELFLIKDNRDVLPPKKLVPPKLVKVMKDGEEWFTRVEWYEWIDEKGARKLQKYKISQILKETLSNPIKSRKIYYKSNHPLFLIKTLTSFF